jgi:hypothetical protein
MDLSATRHGPACPSRASGWESRAPAVGASRVASLSMYRHAVALTPVGSPWGSSCSPDLATAAFPILLTGRLPHQPFRGLLGVHGCYGLPARGAASAALSIEGFGSFVTSTTAPIATGWSNSCRVGLTPTEERHLSTAHKRTLLVLLSVLLSVLLFPCLIFRFWPARLPAPRRLIEPG